MKCCDWCGLYDWSAYWSPWYQAVVCDWCWEEEEAYQDYLYAKDGWIR